MCYQYVATYINRRNTYTLLLYIIYIYIINTRTNFHMIKYTFVGSINLLARPLPYKHIHIYIYSVCKYVSSNVYIYICIYQHAQKSTRLFNLQVINSNDLTIFLISRFLLFCFCFYSKTRHVPCACLFPYRRRHA